MQKEQFDITGMSCAACSARVDKAVSSLTGVDEVSVNLLKGTMAVSFDPAQTDADQIIDSVKKAGYGASLKTSARPASGQAPSKAAADETHQAKIRLVCSLLAMVPLCYLGMGPMLGLPLPPFLAGSANVMALAFTQFLLATIVVGLNIRYFTNGFKALASLAPNMDALIAIGSGAAFVSGIVSIYTIGGALGAGDMAKAVHAASHLHLDSAAMILTLISLGRYLEARAKGRTTEAIAKLIDLSPKTATRLDGAIETTIPVEDVRVGDILVVRAGESIPVDGTITDGWGTIDTSALTGEPIPVEKTAGATVSAATINLSGHFTMRATRVGENTALAQIIRLVDEATSSKAPVSRLADRVSAVFVPAVIAVAVIATITWLCFGYPLDFALSIGISVLVISCPCSLGLATPTAIMVGTGRGAASGILFRSAAAIERLGSTDTAVLDKTGTMTAGKPALTDFAITTGFNQEQVLAQAAALENRSEHPLGKAIVSTATKMGIPLPATQNFRQIPGEGITGIVAGIPCAVGNARLMQNLNLSLPENIQKTAEDLANEGKTVLYIATGNTLSGLFALADTIRPTTPGAIKGLQQMGIDVIMLTGDNAQTAKAVQAKTGVKSVIAEVLPQDKDQVLKDLKDKGHKTVMVGDGINDAPALARADVGIAIGAGTDVAVESADVVLMKDDLTDAVTAIRLSKAVMRTIRQNLFWAFAYNIIGIPVAAGILYPINGMTLAPIAGAAAMSLSSVSVVLNALRLRFFEMASGNIQTDSSPNTAVQPPNFLTLNTKKENTMQKKINIEGMNCNHCRAAVEKALSAIPGVESVNVSLEDKQATVSITDSVTEAALANAITNAGFECKTIA